MQNKILKIGHRGALGHVAENTLESIQKAVEFGADGVEIDVHACSTGELMVFHDFTLDRTTNGTGEISKKSLKSLRKLKVEGSFRIPVLEEVLEALDKQYLINIELKGDNTALKVVKVIEQYVEEKGWQFKDFLVSSFRKDLLLDMHASGLPISTGVLSDTNLDEAIQLGLEIEAASIHPHYTMLTKHNVRRIQSLGFQVITYTVNKPEDIKRMKSYGVNGIISDYPDRL